MKNIILVDKTHGIKERISFSEAFDFIKANHDKKDKPFWIDFHKPTAKELAEIAQIIPIHHLTQEDILSKTVREKSEDFEDYLYVVGQALNFNPGHELLDTVNVSMVVFSTFILSFHAKKVKNVNVVLKRIKEENRGKLPNEDWALYAILDALVDVYDQEVNQFCDEIDAIDQAVLAYDNPNQLLHKIGESRPVLAQFRRRLAPKKEFLQLLCYRDHSLVSAPTKILLRDVYDHTIRMQEVLEVARDTLASAQSNYLAQVSNRMNEVMKTLSIVATIMLPLSLVTGLFGINVHVPGQEAEGNYWFFGIVFSMMVMTISMIVYFRRRRWF